MQRVSVVGSSGSGKTTLARRLAAALDVPYVELDALFWEPGWSPAGTVEFRERVDAVIGRDSWVVNGNYQSKIGTLVWMRADSVVWIDAPRWRAMAQVLARSVRRAVTRHELWNGNRETWKGLWLWRGDDSILRWAWTSYRPTRDRYESAMREAGTGPGPRWYRLRTRREVKRFLGSVER